VAKQIEKQQKTATGILIARDAQEAPEMAEVIAVGPKVKDVKVGDVVVYKTYASPIKVEGEEFLVLTTDSDDLEKEGEILAVVAK
jgi:chaperonin GroES